MSLYLLFSPLPLSPPTLYFFFFLSVPSSYHFYLLFFVIHPFLFVPFSSLYFPCFSSSHSISFSFPISPHPQLLLFHPIFPFFLIYHILLSPLYPPSPSSNPVHPIAS